MKYNNTYTYHYIYIITRKDGKYYIGMHSTNNLDDGYFGSGKYLKHSIEKHGLDFHQKTIVEFHNSRVMLAEREREMINNETLADPLCMNIVIGGNGGCSPESQFKRSSAGGKIAGPKTVKTMLTPEAMAKSLCTRKLNNLFGNVQASAAALSPESKEKRKRTFAERNHSKGENNSQFGTCWVTKDNSSIKIKKHELDMFIDNGYTKGRKIKGLKSGPIEI